MTVGKENGNFTADFGVTPPYAELCIASAATQCNQGMRERSEAALNFRPCDSNACSPIKIDLQMNKLELPLVGSRENSRSSRHRLLPTIVSNRYFHDLLFAEQRNEHVTWGESGNPYPPKAGTRKQQRDSPSRALVTTHTGLNRHAIALTPSP
ncbi:hypothetical protein AB3332_10290 [Ralstonia solanacearum]|uniref:hypothetical protein n=1 Tax=Ralstonia solanacearum TaxID=305 RepID=UPI0034DD80E6